MIQAEDFVGPARAAGFRWFAGVPCSFLTPFINHVIDSKDLRYISSANEGDAVATVAGAALGGELGVAMMQNSGLGNAVSPLTSLTWPFRIPLLLIVTWRGDPQVKDEPQHKLIGEITPKLLETMEIPWELFPDKAEDVIPALHRAKAHMEAHSRPYAFIMRKGTVAACGLSEQAAQPKPRVAVPKRYALMRNERVSRAAALQRIVELTPDRNTVLIGTTGFTGRELFALEDRHTHLYMVGSMGCAPSLGLGLALARPDLRVVVIDGDGAALMRMGNFATVGAYARENYYHVLLDNEVHDSTGAQATVSASVSFAESAAACGYAAAMEGDQLDLIDELFALKDLQGPRLLQLKTKPGSPDNLPRPKEGPAEVRARLQAAIGPAPRA
jgi:phosphonopyruvate decarboxylase